MKVKSFVRKNQELVVIEVEITLIPGLPQMHFLGLADQNIKESSLRIRSALKQCGFEWPRAQQIIVNLRPNQEKKTSAGLDLAVALGILWETQQISPPMNYRDHYVYGEITLSGEVFEPEDLHLLRFHHFSGPLVTGQRRQEIPLPVQRVRYSSLARLDQFEIALAESVIPVSLRPAEGLEVSYSEEQAQLLKILALGGHSCLIAGPAGTGKSCLSQAIKSFLPLPDLQESLQILRQQNSKESASFWRSEVKPHHTTPLMSLIGGGAQLFEGEMQKSHLGVLVLEELLEFSPKFLEALREPLEDQLITTARLGKVVKRPWRAHVVATTNLCPCGQFVPGQRVPCRFSLKKCQSYSERLTGPLTDRFECLAFSQSWSHRFQCSGHSILEKIEAARAWLKIENFNSLPREEVISLRWPKKIWRLLPLRAPSVRRHNAIVKVSMTMADLEHCREVKQKHLQKALELTHFNHLKLQTYGVNKY